MAERNTWMIQASKEFKKKLDEVRLERIKIGKDKEIQPYRRLTLAIARHERLIQDLIKADFTEDKNVTKKRAN